MNFKTIFSIAVLAFTAVNASPVDEVSRIKKECEGDGKAKFLLDESSSEYTCIRAIDDREGSYRTCFFTNDNSSDVVCIEEGFNNIPSCSKNSGASDYVYCAAKIVKMLEKDDKLAYRIRKYPNHEKLLNGYLIDKKECEGHDGIYLTNKEIFQYVCLEPANPHILKSLKDSQCARVNGDLYFVHQDNTSVDVCNKRHKNYDYDACKRILKEYGTVNHLDVEILEDN